MTKKFKSIAVLLAAVIVVITSILGIMACSGSSSNNEEKIDNYAEIVFKDNADGGTLYTYSKGTTGWGYNTITDYTFSDLLNNRIAFDNYGKIYMDWATDKYKVTKVEFDAVAKDEDIDVGFSCFNGNIYFVNFVDMTISTTETHFSYDIEATKTKFDTFGLSFWYRNVSDTNQRQWKISNLKITAEKV
jgi:hypothetical protein